MSDQDGAPYESGSSKPGSTIGNKIKGVARMIHGIGEAIRGSTMSVVDNTISSRTSGAEENGEITRRGRAEFERGIAEVRGGSGSSTVPTSPGPIPDESWDQPSTSDFNTDRKGGV